MPGKVKVKIVAGRNLPVMDRSNDTTDAYVEVKLGTTTFKTDVCRKSLNPQWNSEWFRFEMDDLELQDEPLQIRLMDHDTYSANDAIGKVYLDLNPLLLTSSKDSSGKLISGWIPVYDTMHGIRGEVNLIVKVELFSDLNKFRQSSCGVMFFFTQAIPDGYYAHSIHGFVEELVVNDDPEYQWIDKIRTPRASNEARQTLFSKLSGEVQRRVGLKALELGGNAVIGYRQCFDLEGESGIVVRGIGTAATLTKQYESQLSPSSSDAGAVSREFQSLDDGLLLPCSSHPTMLSKSSRSKRTGSRVPFSTHSMQENVLPRFGPNRSLLHSRAPSSSSASVTASYFSSSKSKCMTSRCNIPTSASSTISSSSSNSAFRNLLHAVSGRCDNSHHSRSHSDTSVIVHSVASNPVVISRPDHEKFRFLSRPTSLVEQSEPIEIITPVVKVKSIEVGLTEEMNKVSFRAGTESPSSSSGKDFELKLVDADAEEDEDDDEDRKLNERENKFYFLLSKRTRGTKKKDRYSKSSLLKRASMNFADSKRILVPNSKGKEKFTDEITKYFKKKKLLAASGGDRDNDSSSLSESASPYRKVKTGFFRRRHKSGRLQRCNSESFSLGETSVDSLPSIQSDMAFDPRDDTDSNSLESIPRNLQSSPTPQQYTSNLVCVLKDDERSHSDARSVNELGITAEMQTVSMIKRSYYGGEMTSALHESQIADPESTARVIDAVKELGYGMDKPVKLYISSADALLVFDPAKFGNRDNETHIANKIRSNNHNDNDEKIYSSKQVTLYDTGKPSGSSSGNISLNVHISSNKVSYDCLNDHNENDVVAENVPLSVQKAVPLTMKSVGSSCSATTHSTSSIMSYNSSSSSSGLGLSNRMFGHSVLGSPFVRVIPPDKLVDEGPAVVFQLGPTSQTGTSGDSNCSFSSQSVCQQKLTASLSVSVPRKYDPVGVPDFNNTRELTAGMAVGSSRNSTSGDKHAGLHDSDGSKEDANGSLHSEEKQKEHRLLIPCLEPSGHPNMSSSGSSCCNVNPTTTSTTITTFASSTSMTCVDAANTTTTTCTSTAIVTDANVNMSLSSLKNASSTNMHPAPLPTVSKSTSTSNGSSTLVTNRQQNVTSGSSIPNSGSISSVGSSQSKQATQSAIPTTSNLNRRSSESDLSTPPKPVSTNTTTVTTVLASSSHGKTLTFAPMPPRRLITADHFEMLEYPFITLNQLPPGFIQHLGGTVSARSVKLLERISNLDEPESRDSWWTEIRMEIRSHARSVGCNVVLGYEEQTTMCDDVCVLSASGTAAVLSGTLGDTCEINIPSVMKVPAPDPCACARVEKEKPQAGRTESVSSQHNSCSKCYTKLRHGSSESSESNCSLCHIPYNESSVPFPVKMTRCLLCKKGKVPDILLATIELPVGLQCYGKSCLIQAQVFRPKKDCKGEISAKEVSDSLPFLEYELHRRLINKLKVRGMNAIFALQVQICLGEKMMVGLATGTAVFVSCLPSPSVPKISAGNLKTDSQKVIQFQKVVQEVYERNKEVYDLKNTVPINVTNGNQSVSSDGEDSDEDLPDIDLATGNKDTYVLEVDDAEDIDIIQVLIDPSPELGFYMNNINFLHGFENYRVTSQQMFTQVWRCRISPFITLRQFTNYFDKLLQAVAFKLRRISPCVLSKLRYRVELPEQDEIQLSIIGLAVKIEENKNAVDPEATPKNGTDHQENEPEATGSPSHTSAPITIVSASAPTPVSVSAAIDNPSLLQANSAGSSAPASTASPGSPGAALHPGYNLNTPKSKAYPRAVQLLSRPKCIEITPLSHIPGGKIEKYLGNLNFFFIRETTSIRENGGLSGFVHSFIAEILAIVRAHVAALGGNAMVSYFMTELALLHNPHKNQGQCLVNVGGDVVFAVYPNSL